jgi:hypothetical protein
MATIRITKIQVGQLTDVAVIDCIAPEVPVKIFVQDVDTGVQFPLQICFNPTSAPCDSHGMLGVLEGAGYLIEGDPCA